MEEVLKELEIRRHVKDYLAGARTLTQFNRWFVPFTGDVHKSPVKSYRDFVYSLALNLAEFTSGHRTEAEIRDLFSRALSTMKVSMATEEKLQMSDFPISKRVVRRIVSFPNVTIMSRQPQAVSGARSQAVSLQVVGR